ncbi:MAG: J domain-containing protein [Bacillota bacterium]|jgi:curved DNA-binding protein CbpA
MTDYHEVDYYKIIGVGREATVAQIRAAYRAKARASHPDVCRDPNAARAFTQLVEAYGVLSDAGKRRAYDASLDRDRAVPGTPIRFRFRLRPVTDRVTRWLPEDPLPLLMQALQVIGLFLAAALLLLAALYVL